MDTEIGKITEEEVNFNRKKVTESVGGRWGSEQIGNINNEKVMGVKRTCTKDFEKAKDLM